MGTGAPASAETGVSHRDREALVVLLSVDGLGPMTLNYAVDAALVAVVTGRT